MTARLGTSPTKARDMRWRPKALPGAGDFREWFAQHSPLLPAPPPARPQAGAHTSKSSRLRSRLKRRRAVWQHAANFIATLNSLDEGKCLRKTVTSSPSCQSPEGKEALSQLHQVALREASRLERVRRSSCSTGVASLAALVKSSAIDDYTVRDSTKSQVPMIAEAIDEPSYSQVVDLLSVLSPEESRFYSCEENVIDCEGKSLVISQELEERYGFIGGSVEEYEAYFHRELPPQMWHWATRDQVKTIAGFSVVPKKNPLKQRKLLMQCAANYWWCDCRSRENHGMLGGTALARMHVDSNCVAAGAFDESNAFTSVLTPPWMWGWCSAPPLVASRVWKVLPEELRARITPQTQVFPQYMRLAMGSSHSVHLLMNINVSVVGRALCTSYRPCIEPPHQEIAQPAVPLEAILEDQPINVPKEQLAGSASTADDLWLAMKKAATVSASMLSLDEFCHQVRSLKQRATRTCVVLNLFAGPRRCGDIEEWTTRLCAAAGIALLFCSVDLLVDSRWDLAAPETFLALMMLAEEGLIDIVLGGPPCSTFSKLRFLPGGPPPLRLRGQYVWGLPGLTLAQKARVREGNVLMVNFLALAEAVSLRGGGHLLEHPADPGCEPFPSIWSTEELRALEARCCAIRLLIHQCMFGGPARKDTFLSGTLDGLDIPAVTCDKSYQHAAYVGGSVNGAFKSRELATYPEGLCKFIAELIVASLQRFVRDDTGPSGGLRSGLSCPRLSHWSTCAGPERERGISVVNELAVKNEGVVLSHTQGAMYMHVDDGLILFGGTPPTASKTCEVKCPDAQAALLTNETMEFCSEALEQVGFSVGSREGDGQLTKIIGYELVRFPAQLRLPAERAVLLQDALYFLASCAMVTVDLVRSVLGTWIWAALLKREALCIPFHVFRFCQKCEGQRVRWWPQVRNEIRAMADVVPHLVALIGAPLLDTIFATDAMGEAHDNGGWGIVAADVPHELALECYRKAHKPGKSVVKLSGDYGGENNPDTPFLRKVPFCRLPREIFNEEHTQWQDVAAGRWRYADPIALGESRAVVRLVRGLAAHPKLHSAKAISLEDNSVTSGSMAKGRSPAPALNYLCRQRAASCLGARLGIVLPWTETTLMPADELSRYGFSGRPAAAGRPPTCEDHSRQFGAVPQSHSPFRGMVGGA